ncbi:hypothetical protein Afil01_45970 [Actinorhabdospora filicis]|uniref:Uncharacterized protein n=1 Tax=Actinorhabdospora filicis TaxID=1785913 RepID=A0A9W6WCH6_9ACTN|nr:hypothetical protein [Actinorhabdospora filicis]GLZ79790.1 hypothetical protein Afil01_45970 [Actinorhabdospora filicis]
MPRAVTPTSPTWTVPGPSDAVAGAEDEPLDGVGAGVTTAERVGGFGGVGGAGGEPRPRAAVMAATTFRTVPRIPFKRLPSMGHLFDR